MGRRESLSLFEMELYHKTGTLSKTYKADDQRPYPREGISCAIMTRGVITDDAKNTSKYEMFINRFVSVSIRRGIRRFIIALRNANDVLCAEIVQKHIFRSEGVKQRRKNKHFSLRIHCCLFTAWKAENQYGMTFYAGL